jgi:hypothetical protein
VQQVVGETVVVIEEEKHKGGYRVKGIGCRR